MFSLQPDRHAMMNKGLRSNKPKGPPPGTRGLTGFGEALLIAALCASPLTLLILVLVIFTQGA